MRKFESIKEFYASRHLWLPDDIKKNLGHFNVFPLEYPAIGKGAAPLEYGRREWFNIVLAYGGGILHCAGNQYRVKKHAIVFTNPYKPFGWNERDLITKGYYCIFNEEFLKKDKRIIEFPPFKTTSTPFHELTREEANEAERLFKRMFAEVSTQYIYKYDVAKLLVEDLLHLTMKSKSYEEKNRSPHNASERITLQFLELLERQFPIEEPTQTLRLLKASDFANELHVHVNHLNKAVKEISGKATTQIIKERIVQEAKILIQQTNWNISEIAYALGFTEPTHFNNFFKKHVELSPLKFRNV